jgi:hypothetical protein
MNESERRGDKQRADKLTVSANTAYSKPSTDQTKSARDTSSYKLPSGWRFWREWNTKEKLQAIFDLFLVAFTGGLWWTSCKQWQTTQEALVSVQRAFVAVNGFRMSEIIGPDGHAMDWDFTVEWINSGTTPTKVAKTHVSWLPMQTPIADNFPFPDLGGSGNETSFTLGPKATVTSTHFRISPSDMRRIIDHQEYFYVWGWVKYRDVFHDTNRRATEFCNSLTDFGDDPFSPHTQSPNFVMSECNHHNCADEQCAQEDTGPSGPK